MPQTAITPNRNVPAIGNDIAKILADVKLPERREPVISGEKTIAEAQKKFDTSIVGSAMHDPADKAAGAAPAANTVSQSGPKEAEKNPSSVAAVHTLKNDLQGVVQDKKISLVRAVSLEEDRRARKVAPVETPATQQRSKRTFAIIFTTLILLGLGVAALFGVFFVMNQSQAPLPTDTSSSILFAEQSVLLPLEGQSPGDLKRLLESGRAGSGGALGSITRIIPVIVAASTDDPVQNRAATFGEFMTAIGAHPPEELLRALGGDFFFGIHTADENAPLFVVPVTSHDHAFAAMLNWEEVLNADLAPVFTFVPTLASDANGLPVQRTYQDVVMRNYDVRALRDDAGDIQLYYSFPTQNILVIAESPYSFTEILSRLQAGRKL
ncbi:hypothetical protein A3C18_02920 [Candidatus Kaiserbacteria bacterium RIFCSPHIGHO2_02_FULL_54_11b]|uniref:Uncharacterized protein n=2 Tax=Candidatus Kaiseribacteriota TaxID=1752734 RepID=A0A1F6CQR4_9BACT|nr:MAG: hypothetical protein A2704_04865 [Candidatus Kaiserbacteria bacterium RIFCSPHIGHO2_01_FULL_54_36b]OGG63858.1 MAG: hypothetical protein A3C18_02920 [Candidatus Kaiserbacteria bacterium RIFCSPHIGHO2_02_FULL_54_11b]